MTRELENKFLGGAVSFDKLSSKADEKGRFRGGDERGEVAVFLSNLPVEYVEYAEFSGEGVKRGFHYHAAYTEHVYVLKGRLVFVGSLVGGEGRIEISVSAGDLLTIAPGVAHAFMSCEKSAIIAAGHGENPFVDRHVFKNLAFSSENK